MQIHSKTRTWHDKNLNVKYFERSLKHISVNIGAIDRNLDQTLQVKHE